MSDVTPPAPELDELVALFYSQRQQLGEFSERSADQCPEAYRTMLAHNAHMTVAVERRHGCSVDVEVLEKRTTDRNYLRKINLRRRSDGRVVQFGIVRLALDALQPAVRDEIMGQMIPLGRVLIEHNVLRQVELTALWEVRCGPELAAYFGVEPNHLTYGRTALIYCEGEPTVELLEIVAPEDSFPR